MAQNKHVTHESMPLPLFLNTKLTVVETLWDLALAYFTIRTAAIYALVTLAADVLLSCAAGWSQMPTVTVTLTSAPLRALLVAACAWAVVLRYEMPRDWRFRGAVGGVAWGVMAGVGEVVRIGGCGMEIEVGRTAVLAGMMPLVLMAFEGREGWEKLEEDRGEKDVRL
ncbi:hypothetical protein ACHAQH_000640 [Verticillium albo-atrum]